MPFWVDIVHDCYLPDLLHAAILAAILLCLLYGYTGFALLLLFPAYLARESTILVAACLLFACWRRIPLRSALIGLTAMGAAAWSAGTSAKPGLPACTGSAAAPTYWVSYLEFFQEPSRSPSVEQHLARMPPGLGLRPAAGYHLGAIQTIGVMPALRLGPGASSARLVWHLWYRARARCSLLRGMRQLLLPAQGREWPGSPAAHRLQILHRVWRHQHPHDPVARRQRRSPGRIRLALLLCRSALVCLPFLPPPALPRCRAAPAAPGYLLARVVWFPAAPPFLLAGLAVLGLNGVGYVLVGPASSVT